MSNIPLDEVLRTLRLFPQGATVKELAARLGADHRNIGCHLSKAFMYGRGVNRRNQVVADSRGRHDQYIYTVER